MVLCGNPGDSIHPLIPSFRWPWRISQRYAKGQVCFKNNAHAIIGQGCQFLHGPFDIVPHRIEMLINLPIVFTALTIQPARTVCIVFRARRINLGL